MARLSNRSIISMAVALGLIGSLILSFSKTRTLNFYDDILSLGPTIIIEESKPYPPSCSTIDYVMTEKQVTGWPFTTRVYADDICGVYFPQDSETYTGSYIANFLVVSLPLLGTVFIVLKKKEDLK